MEKMEIENTLKTVLHGHQWETYTLERSFGALTPRLRCRRALPELGTRLS